MERELHDERYDNSSADLDFLPDLCGGLRLNQRLILACYRLETGAVVDLLRKGADVNARFGDSDQAIDAFTDRWTGGQPVALPSWTPLIALANSNEYPDPPAELGNIWRNRAQSDVIRRRIPQERIDERRKNVVVILYILRSHNCSLEGHDECGATALFEAVNNQKVSMVEMLLEYGANSNVRVQAEIDGPSDVTPLHVACQSRKLVQLLLNHGADANAKDSDGKTPSDWIALNENRAFDLVKSAGGWRVQSRSGRKAPTPGKAGG